MADARRTWRGAVAADAWRRGGRLPARQALPTQRQHQPDSVVAAVVDLEDVEDAAARARKKTVRA